MLWSHTGVALTSWETSAAVSVTLSRNDAVRDMSRHNVDILDKFISKSNPRDY